MHYRHHADPLQADGDRTPPLYLITVSWMRWFRQPNVMVLQTLKNAWFTHPTRLGCNCIETSDPYLMRF